MSNGGLASLPAASRSAPWLIAAAREAQRAWGALPVALRLRVIRELRHSIADSATRLADALRLPWRTSRWETWSAELVPLAEACRFLELQAAALLAPRKMGRRGRPLWLFGSHAEVLREPWGVVLVLGPANYPLLLPGVQIVQALTAGNAVLVKPAPATTAVVSELASLLAAAGLPHGLLTVLEESPSSGAAAIRAGVDKVVLTGSYETGLRLAEQLSSTLTPAVMELSGCDAAFVQADADLALAARAVIFGLTLNGGFTCISPRRVFVHVSRSEDLLSRLRAAAANAPEVPLAASVAARVEPWIREATASGATLVHGKLPLGPVTRPLVLSGIDPESPLATTDFAAPLVSVFPVRDDDEALRLARVCRFELGATVFGSPGRARALARRVPAGVVVINDMIVPTADPRLPFGGRGKSGYGLTRGAEGLLELTRVRTVVRRGGRARPHLGPVGQREGALLEAFLRASHGRSWSRRLGAVRDLLRIAISGASGSTK